MEVVRQYAVLYGSQTGTAQETAERIWREGKRFHWQGPIKAMDEFPTSALPEQPLVIFVCSTTGQGDEPDNMKRFWKFLLRKSLPKDSLSNTNVAVLGLGDSSYTKFNFAAKKLYKRLIQLGAKSVVELGLADDQHDLGPEAIILPWLQSLWKKLHIMYPLPANIKPLDESVLLSPRYYVMPVHESAGQIAKEPPPETFNDEPPLICLVGNTRLTGETHFQDVRLLRFKTENISNRPGDVLIVQPENLEENVSLFLKLMKVDADTIIEIHQSSEEFAFDLPPNWLMPKPCTMAECARKLLDLQAIPHRYALYLLAHFTKSSLEKERLLEFCSPEGQQDLFDYCHRPRRSILEVLQDFPYATASLPLTYIFDIFRPIRPRAFSIASACEMQKGIIEILLAVVNYKTRVVAPRLGLCSNWLARLKLGETLRAWVQSGSLNFPDPETPLIMVGPGTGCAPFRSLVQQRMAECPQIKGKLTLFFGCRFEHQDFLCQEEWNRYVAQRILNLICAFSRDQENKVYVQHKIKEMAEDIWRILHHENGAIMIAGNAKNMPDAVRSSLLEIVCQQGNLSNQEANVYLRKLEYSGRYQTETWS